ncbi:MAG: uracil phosphoribosyltransferase [Flavobacteriales bacterium]|nr:uracil phosphoribosyltransferase [Flavobacteriales bacterium]
MLHELIQTPSIASTYLAEMRDESIQKDRVRFRLNLERVGSCIAWEISKHLEYQSKEVQTPLGVAMVDVLKEQPVLATIMRAGLPMHQGMMRVFDWADHAFAAAYRQQTDGDDFEIQVDYISTPSLEGRTLILADPMLATGASMVRVYEQLLAFGTPAHIHIACVLASREGIDEIRSQLPPGVQIWAGAVDDTLTSKGYIVPGLGDAGDLTFGTKMT